MARARTKARDGAAGGHDSGAPDASRTSAHPSHDHAQASPIAEAVSAVAHGPQGANGTGATRSASRVLALQRAAGNTVTRKAITHKPIAVTPAPDSQGPQRLWTPVDFAAKTYESLFTSRDPAQKALVEMITSYSR